jgi:DNA-directed RNA polymerase I, II, and III subunit RPABC1
MDINIDMVHIVLIEMMEQRLYSDIENHDEYISANNINNERFLAFKNITKDLNIDEIQKFVNIMDKKKINHILIIYCGNPTPAVKNVIDNMINIKKQIELFNVTDLQYNITKHYLVPQHVLLNDEEMKEFKIKYDTLIPVILYSDPICKFYNFPKGSIIKIIRKNKFISYRIVK